MSLVSYALTTVDSVKRFMRKTDSDFKIPVITLYNSSSDASAATYQVTDTTLRLIVTGGVNNDDTTLTLADADKDTLTELVTYINDTLGKGWVATLVANGGQSSGSLSIIEATSCLLAANQKSLYAPNDLLLEDLINASTDFIERYCNRRFAETTYSEELYDGQNEKDLYLKNFPITELTSLYYHWVDTDDILIPSGDYKVYANRGYIYYPWGFAKGRQNYLVNYKAGYTTIPNDLAWICNSLVTLWYNNPDNKGVKAERLGNYSITYSEEDIPKEIKTKMNAWSKISVF